MKNLEERIWALENFKKIRNYLPNDHSKRQSLNFYIQKLRNEFANSPKVLDLGCGDGNSINIFKQIYPEIIWHGIDVEDSPEVRRRTNDYESILTFDGINLPYSNNFFSLIYCNQVLEHVRFPDKLIAEAFRVLKPNGVFIGAVSYLEPYHSYSI